MNRPPRYTGTAIALHWIAALLILGNVAFGLYMVDLPLSPAKLRYYSWHKWVGVTVFVLSGARLLWRLSHPAPALPASMPPWQRKAANVSHVLLYALFFAVPLSGWLFSSAAGFPTVYLGLVQLPDLIAKNRELADVLKVVHRAATWSLGTLAMVHAAAAVKHHVVDRDDVLARMLPIPKSRT